MDKSRNNEPGFVFLRPAVVTNQSRRTQFTRRRDTSGPRTADGRGSGVGGGGGGGAVARAKLRRD